MHQVETGELIPLKFVKFQNVQNIQLFIKVGGSESREGKVMVMGGVMVMNHH